MKPASPPPHPSGRPQSMRWLEAPANGAPPAGPPLGSGSASASGPGSGSGGSMRLRRGSASNMSASSPPARQAATSPVSPAMSLPDADASERHRREMLLAEREVDLGVLRAAPAARTLTVLLQLLAHLGRAPLPEELMDAGGLPPASLEVTSRALAEAFGGGHAGAAAGAKAGAKAGAAPGGAPGGASDQAEQAEGEEEEEEVSIKALNAVFARYPPETWIRVVKVVAWNVDIVPRHVARMLLEACELASAAAKRDPVALFGKVLEEMPPMRWHVLASLCALLQRDRRNRKAVVRVFGPCLFLPHGVQHSFHLEQTAAEVLELMLPCTESLFARSAARGVELSASLTFVDEAPGGGARGALGGAGAGAHLGKQIKNLFAPVSGSSSNLGSGSGSGSGPGGASLLRHNSSGGWFAASASGSRRGSAMESGGAAARPRRSTLGGAIGGAAGEGGEGEEFRLETLPELERAVQRLKELNGGGGAAGAAGSGAGAGAAPAQGAAAGGATIRRNSSARQPPPVPVRGAPASAPAPAPVSASAPAAAAAAAPKAAPSPASGGRGGDLGVPATPIGGPTPLPVGAAAALSSATTKAAAASAQRRRQSSVDSTGGGGGPTAPAPAPAPTPAPASSAPVPPRRAPMPPSPSGGPGAAASGGPAVASSVRAELERQVARAASSSGSNLL